MNLEVVLKSLTTLKGTLKELTHRAADLVDERRSGTFTSACSRSDLFAIAYRLPPRSEWRSSEFEKAREAIRQEFGLSSRQVSDALNAIQGHRQLGAIIGLEFDLAHLGDDSAISAIGLWRTLHPKTLEDTSRRQPMIWRASLDIEDLQRQQEASNKQHIGWSLSSQQTKSPIFR